MKIKNGPNVELLAVTPQAELLIERCARVCYNSEDKIQKGYLKQIPSSDISEEVLIISPNFLKGIIKKGHLSVLEHASATFKISNISRALSHQLVRHRLASYSQMSQRYVKEENFIEDMRFTIPSLVAEKTDSGDGGNISLLEFQLIDIEDCYRKMLRAGVPAEDARYVLPNAIHTTIVMTANFREWRHFLDMRGDRHAQWEIRKLACIIWKQLYDIAPIIFGDYILSKTENNTEILIRPKYLSIDDIIEIQGKQISVSHLADIFNAKDARTAQKEK